MNDPLSTQEHYMKYTPDIPLASPLTLLWKDAKPTLSDTSRVGQMLSYLNYRHLINTARRRNGNNAVTAMLSMATAMGYVPATGWRKLYNRLRAATYAPVKNFLSPTKSESGCMAGDELCSCSR